MRVEPTTGAAIELGDVETGATVGITDYSVRTTDDFGVTTVVRRGFARTLSVKLGLPFEDVDGVQRALAALRATTVRWIADERFAWLQPQGFFKDFSLDLSTPARSFCTLTVEGLAETEAVADTGGDPATDGQVSTLRLLQPFDITDAALAVSTVAETDEPQWSSVVAYPIGARVMSVAAHRLYESLVAANAGHDPVSSPDAWLDVGPTNRWAMFDQALGTATVAAGSISVAVDAGTIDAVALLDVVGATVRVSAGGYDRTQQVGSGSLVFLDLGGLANRVTITVTGPGQVGIGTLLIGRLTTLGVTESSPTAGIIDYSRKQVDEFGAATVVERAWAKRMTAKALIRTEAIDLVANRIAGVRAIPVLWIGGDDLDSLTVYGFFKDFSIEVRETTSILSLSIEGLSAAAKVAPLVASIDWPDVGDPDGTKPDDNADVTADHTAADTAAVGGRPTADILEAIDLIAPITVDVSALTEAKVGTDAALGALADATIDLAAADRQADADRGSMSEALLRLVTEAGRTRDVLRDAGITVDPVTGTVRLYAIDRLAERQSSAEVALDAVAARVTLKADTTYVDQAVLLAQLDPSTAADLTPLFARVGHAEADIDALHAAVSLKASALDLAGLSGTLTTVSQTLDALAGTVDTKADSTVVDQLAQTVTSVEQTLGNFGDVAGLSVTVRQVRSVADDAAEAGLRALLGGDQAAQRQLVSAAEARQELTTRLTDGLAAEASARISLAVQLGAADAQAVQQITALAAADKIQAERIDALGVSSGDQAAAIGTLQKATIAATGGIASITTTIRQQAGASDADAEATLRALIAGDDAARGRAAQIVQLQTELTTTLVANALSEASARQVLLARLGSAEAAIITSAKVQADATQALATRMDASEAAYADPVTGLPATRAALSSESVERANGDKAQSDRTDALVAELSDPQTGLPATRAQIVQQGQTLAEADEANADAIRQVSADLGGETDARRAAVSDEAQARVDGDGAVARSVQQVSTTVDGHTASIELLFESIDGQHAVAQLAVDVDGNLVGFRIDGVDHTFKVRADRFVVGSEQVFEVDTTTGKTTMHDVEVDTLAINTAITPAFLSASDAIRGTGAAS